MYFVFSEILGKRIEPGAEEVVLLISKSYKQIVSYSCFTTSVRLTRVRDRKPMQN